MAKVAGVVKVRLGGTDYRTKQGATLETGGERSTSQYASGARSGSSKEPVGSKITVTFELMGDTDVDAIRTFAGNAEYVTDVGKTWIAPNSEIMEPPVIRDNGGGVEVTIEGDAAVQA